MPIHRVRAALVLATLVAAGHASAQVIAHPNQIVGTVGFSNVNPAVLAYLNDPGDVPPGQGLGLVTAAPSMAESRYPAPRFLAYGSSRPATSRLLGDYEITVEAGPPGLGYEYGVTFDLSLAAGRYYLSANSSPVEEEPAPDVVLDVRECAGIVRIPIEDEFGAPVALDFVFTMTGLGSAIQAESTQSSATEIVLVRRGDGLVYDTTVWYSTGTSDYVDRLNWEVKRMIAVGCDEVVTDAPIVIYGAGRDPLLGRIVGNLDMLREDELWTGDTTRMAADSGPFFNFRRHLIARTPSAGAFELPNLMPSSVVTPPWPYRVQAELEFRAGDRGVWFRSPARQGAQVEPGATLDIGDAFVMDPGYIAGDVLIAGPPPDPILGSVLSDLPNKLSVLSMGTASIAPGASSSSDGGASRAGAPGTLDATSTTWTGDFEMVLAGLNRESSVWTHPGLVFELRDIATPAVPESYVDSSYVVIEDLPDKVVVPTATLAASMHYCLSQLRLRIHSQGGEINEPSLADLPAAGFDGVDFELRRTKYHVDYAKANGTPREPNRATDALLVLTLPQGTYRLTPSVNAFSVTGGRSRLTLAPVDITLGCAEVIDAWTTMIVAPTPLTRCTSNEVARIAGEVRGTATVDRLEYQLNGAPPVPLCGGGCGVAPTFAFDAPLVDGANRIEIAAYDADGRRSSAALHTELDPSTEPIDRGNVLTAVKAGTGVRLGWSQPATAFGSDVLKSSDRDFASSTSIATLLGATSGFVDPTQLPGARALRSYRVRGIDCAGTPGP